ncbi:hypothetical protein DM860_016212 [Cuscuta australis]|uniref:Uncharacterized protein n=1 Tax=Cuscuta australis TaxID=267555 RepID=A0A328DV39_9ASTE|nr:hypothetical protein DM860_016212 [Cuscuta australis]
MLAKSTASPAGSALGDRMNHSRVLCFQTLVLDEFSRPIVMLICKLDFGSGSACWHLADYGFAFNSGLGVLGVEFGSWSCYLRLGSRFSKLVDEKILTYKFEGCFYGRF